MRIKAALLILLLLWGCGERSMGPAESAVAEQAPVWRYVETGDLTQIRERGVLRVLVPARPEKEYLPRSADPFERERDLAAAYARELGVELAYVPVEDRAQILPWLVEGRGDLTLVKLPPEDQRGSDIAYSVAAAQVSELVVTRINDERIQDLGDLEGRQIGVLAAGQMTRPAQTLRSEFPASTITAVDGPLTPDDLMYQVAEGELESALVDSNWWEVTQSYRSDLRVAVELPAKQRVAAAVRADAKDLLQSVNDFLLAATGGRARTQISTGDLTAIRESNILRVLMLNRAPSYFLHRGELRGFEYELAREFAKRQQLRLEIVVPPQESDIVPWLLEGRADLVAADLAPDAFGTIEGVEATTPYFRSPDVVVARENEHRSLRLEDLSGASLYASRETRADPAVATETLDLPAEEVIEKVAASEYPLAVVPQHRLSWEMNWRRDVQQALEIGGPQPYVWLVRKMNPQLRDAVNEFLETEYRSTFYNVVRNRYFSQRAASARARWTPSGDGSLSPYDDLVQRYARQFDFEWRLAVALMYQESRFDPQARSSAGAIGLFQMLPETGEQVGVTDLTDPESSTRAALKYLHWIRERFPDDLELAERAAFTAASYNAGYGHVLDAQRLAEEQGLDPNRWFGNVEEAILLLSKPEYARNARFGYCRGLEPYRYVREIRDRFQVYVRQN